MELNHHNSNREVVLAITINPVFIFLKIELKNQSNMFIFEEDAMIASKTKCSLTFTRRKTCLPQPTEMQLCILCYCLVTTTLCICTKFDVDTIVVAK